MPRQGGAWDHVGCGTLPSKPLPFTASCGPCPPQNLRAFEPPLQLPSTASCGCPVLFLTVPRLPPAPLKTFEPSNRRCSFLPLQAVAVQSFLTVPRLPAAENTPALRQRTQRQQTNSASPASPRFGHPKEEGRRHQGASPFYYSESRTMSLWDRKPSRSSSKKRKIDLSTSLQNCSETPG